MYGRAYVCIYACMYIICMYACTAFFRSYFFPYIYQTTFNFEAIGLFPNLYFILEVPAITSLILRKTAEMFQTFCNCFFATRQRISDPLLTSVTSWNSRQFLNLDNSTSMDPDVAVC
jgi:hypothetical protein